MTGPVLSPIPVLMPSGCPAVRHSGLPAFRPSGIVEGAAHFHIANPVEEEL